MDEDVVASLVDIIDSSLLEPQSFCFEITETTLVNNLAHTNEIIEFLHSKNIIVAIDDFGTGFSSLGYLKTLYADKLKIDRTFIKGYPEHDDGTLLKAIISMAHQLKIGVLVEGVENEAHLELIKSVGCKEYQGYFGSKPLKFEEFAQRFLDKS
jgi:EAL domain-containing protein (putative c-di-GMP-specific phosphodiesterase class I)